MIQNNALESQQNNVAI
jgi:septal ring factor EnvC (AmiA/AmiB activator)